MEMNRLIDLVKVLNVRVRNYGGVDIIYIGRRNKSWGFEKSVLSNKRRDIGMNRDESIERYRVWLWGEVKKEGEVYEYLVELVEKLKKG